MKPTYPNGRARTVLRATVCLTLVLLSIVPNSAAGQAQAPNSQAPDSNSDPNHLSAGFTSPATSALIAIHQSKQNIADIVARNLPSAYYNPNLAAAAYDQVRQAQIAATTNGDQQAAAELNSYFNKVKTWAEQYKAARQSMNATETVGADVLAQDSNWQAIESCEKALNTMLSNRVYSEIASCR